MDTYRSVSLLIIFKSILLVNKLFYQQIVTTEDQKDRRNHAVREPLSCLDHTKFQFHNSTRIGSKKGKQGHER